MSELLFIIFAFSNQNYIYWTHNQILVKFSSYQTPCYNHILASFISTGYNHILASFISTGYNYILVSFNIPCYNHILVSFIGTCYNFFLVLLFYNHIHNFICKLFLDKWSKVIDLDKLICRNHPSCCCNPIQNHN